MRGAIRINPQSEPVHHGKISPEFNARLVRLKPDVKLHVILLLRGRNSSRQSNRTRLTAEERRAAIEEIRVAGADALKEVDEILHRYDGRRLSEKPTALGTIPVETTPAGIVALANSSSVQTILEDQPISQVQ